MQIEQLVKLTDIRFHGRAGQGVVTASRLLAEAAIAEGKWVHAFPNFGPERSGAPVSAFTRISDEKFTMKTEIARPDVIVIIDPSLVPDLQYYKGLKDDGIVILNTTEVPDNVKEHLKDKKVYVVDGTGIARKYLGRNIANTVMLGSLLKVTGLVKLESLLEALGNKFKEDLYEKNEKAIREAFTEVKELE